MCCIAALVTQINGDFLNEKTLLAAALLAGFAGAAQAETSVTLYGIIDTGIGYNDVDFKVKALTPTTATSSTTTAASA